jgi:hypothetical protein
MDITYVNLNNAGGLNFFYHKLGYTITFFN